MLKYNIIWRNKLEINNLKKQDDHEKRKKREFFVVYLRSFFLSLEFVACRSTDSWDRSGIKAHFTNGSIDFGQNIGI